MVSKVNSKLVITVLELRRDDDMVCAGGSSSDDLLQALEEYLPVLLGLVEDGKFFLSICNFCLRKSINSAQQEF